MVWTYEIHSDRFVIMLKGRAFSTFHTRDPVAMVAHLMDLANGLLQYVNDNPDAADTPDVPGLVEVVGRACTQLAVRCREALLPLPS